MTMTAAMIEAVEAIATDVSSAFHAHSSVQS